MRKLGLPRLLGSKACPERNLCMAMITQARIEQQLRGIEGLDWITALRSSQIAALARNGLIEQSLFDEKNLAKIRDAVSRARAPLRGRAKIGLRAGRIINKHKMAKHFALTITDSSFSYARREEKIAAEASIEGIY